MPANVLEVHSDACETLDGVAEASPLMVPLPLPVIEIVVLGCWINDPKAWIKKWKSVHLAVNTECAAWASVAADASGALAVSNSNSKGATAVSIAGCSVEAVEGGFDGKQNVMRLTLADNTLVSTIISIILFVTPF